jgi:hypothetical protein
VRLKQAIRETQAAIHEFANIVLRMGRNLHRGFHDIYEPIKGPIERYVEDQKRLASIQEKAKEQGNISQVHTAKHQLHGH